MPRKKIKNSEKKERSSLSIDPDLLKEAKKIAKEKRMSFSFYVKQLILRDLGEK